MNVIIKGDSASQTTFTERTENGLYRILSGCSDGNGQLALVVGYSALSKKLIVLDSLTMWGTNNATLERFNGTLELSNE